MEMSPRAMTPEIESLWNDIIEALRNNEAAVDMITVAAVFGALLGKGLVEGGLEIGADPITLKTGAQVLADTVAANMQAEVLKALDS